MDKLIVINLKIEKLSWSLFMALFGVVFSIAGASSDNVYLIKCGLSIFLCGILCKFIDAMYNFWLKKKCWKPLVITFQALLIVALIFSLFS